MSSIGSSSPGKVGFTVISNEGVQLTSSHQVNVKETVQVEEDTFKPTPGQTTRLGVLSQTYALSAEVGVTKFHADVQAAYGAKIGVRSGSTQVTVDPRLEVSTAGAVGVGADLSVEHKLDNGLLIGASAGYDKYVGLCQDDLSGFHAGVSAGINF